MPGLMRALLQLGERNMLFMLLALVVLMLLVNQVSASSEEASSLPLLLPKGPGEDGRFKICIGDQGYSIYDIHAVNNLYSKIPYAGQTSFHIALNDLAHIAGQAKASLSAVDMRNIFEYVLENYAGFAVSSASNLFGTGDTTLVERISLDECLEGSSDWMKGHYLSSLNP